MKDHKTLYDKIWSSHVITERADGTAVIFVDRHLIHEVTSAQAFDGIRARGLPLAQPDRILAMPDHNLSTGDRRVPVDDPQSKLQLETLERNAVEYGLKYFNMQDPRQGIVHVSGPEQGFTLPGATLVCGDSHTSTHGAFGALSFGIGTSEVEHVFATQTVVRQRSRNMLIEITGRLPSGTTAKDLIMAVIGRIGTAAGTGSVIEFTGEAIEELSMEGRMTVCNMAIELGARSGLIAPDETTFAYLQGRPMVPTGSDWDEAVAHWKTLPTDAGAEYDRKERIDVSRIEPQVTWGTSPEHVLPITGIIPDPMDIRDPMRRNSMARSLAYMDLVPGTRLTDIPIDCVFIGSCTNSRLEDIRAAARIIKGRKVARTVRALVVPGSGLVKRAAEAEGLNKIFIDAGFEWREPGCSMCIALNADKVPPQARCASTSNRNFEGRQGRDSRTHLMSPAMAAAAAVTGRLTDAREFQ